MQQFLVKKLSNEFNIYSDFLIYNSKVKSKNPINRIQTLIEKRKYQVLKKDKDYDAVVYLGFYFPEYMHITWKAKKTIRGVYTDSLPPKNLNFDGSIDEFKKKYLRNTDALVCGSKKIRNKYSNIFAPSYFCNIDVGQDRFKRKRQRNKDKFIVGWTGNPKREFKGFYTYVLPAVEKAKKKYPNIEFKFRFSGPIETLPNFYEDINLTIIASNADAGPSMFGESCLMDIPCISTKVGIPDDVIKDGINGFLVDRDINVITEKIIELYENRKLLKSMSKRIRKDYLKNYSAMVLANDWRIMFNEVLKD